MSKAKYFYVYAVINFEQRRAYIGSRGSEKHPLKDPYMGSYDRKSDFKPIKKLVLSEHESRKEAFEAEREWQLRFDVVESPLFVNKGIVNSLGFTGYGRKLTKEQRKKFIESQQILAKPVTLQNIKTLEILKFSSQTKAARFLGCTITSINNLINGRSKSVRDYVLPGTDIEAVGINGINKKVKLKWIKTGKILSFRSIKEAAEFSGSDRTGISKLLAGEILSSGGYTLPQINELEVGIRRTYKKIRIQNEATKEILEFDSYAKAAKYLGCYKTGITKLAKQQVKRIRGHVLAPKPDLVDS